MRLSLCIPTYKRAALLQEALSAIQTQWQTDLTQEQQGLVEVIISDNASPDETPEVIASFHKKYPCLNLKSIRQPENIGGGPNGVFLIQQAVGEYVFLLSDDDILLPGGLAKIFHLMDTRPDLDGFCLNVRSFVHHESEPSPPVLTLSGDRILKSADEVLLFLGTWITFLSIMVFRRDAVVTDTFIEKAGSNIPQCYVFIDVLSRSRGLFITKDPFLAVRDNYIGGYSFFEVFVTHFQGLLIYAQTVGCSREAMRQVLKQHLRRFLFPFLVTIKCRQAPGRPAMDYWEGARRLLQVYSGDPFLLLVVLPLLLAPSPAIRTSFALYRSLKRKKSLYDVNASSI